ncbi:MAG: hypothetical protein ACI4MI_04985 [Christensenellales bacterium]
MNKKALVILSFVLIICLCFVGCVEQKSNIEKVNDLISLRQTMFLEGGNEDFRVSINQTQQEELFIADGKVGKIVEKTDLTVKPNKADLLDKSYKYTIVGEKGTLEGELVKDKLGVLFVDDIEGISNLGRILQVKIRYDEQEVTIELADKMADCIDSNTAVEIAYNTFKDKIDAALASEEGLCREVYVKMVFDKEGNNSDVYWYVSFIASRSDYWSVLINSATGEVISKREHCIEK